MSADLDAALARAAVDTALRARLAAAEGALAKVRALCDRCEYGKVRVEQVRAVLGPEATQ